MPQPAHCVTWSGDSGWSICAALISSLWRACIPSCWKEQMLIITWGFTQWEYIYNLFLIKIPLFENLCIINIWGLALSYWKPLLKSISEEIIWHRESFASMINVSITQRYHDSGFYLCFLTAIDCLTLPSALLLCCLGGQKRNQWAGITPGEDKGDKWSLAKPCRGFIKHWNSGGDQLWNRQHGGNRPEDTLGESMINENVSHLKLFEPAGICPSRS